MAIQSEISREILEAARRGLIHERTKLEEQIQAIEHMLRRVDPGPMPAPSTSGAEVSTKKRTMSASARKRIAEAQRKRWAAAKSAETVQSTKAGSTAKRKSIAKATQSKRVRSPEVRARMAEAQRKRWADKKK